MKCKVIVFLFICISSFTHAQTLQVSVEIPEIMTVEYHRPYVSVWLEDAQREPSAQLALWLEQEKWHRDLRYWWRRAGQNRAQLIDAYSGATRKPGKYEFSVPYLRQKHQVLVVEAVREVGGRELIKLPLAELKAGAALSTSGERELGLIHVSLNAEK